MDFKELLSLNIKYVGIVGFTATRADIFCFDGCRKLKVSDKTIHCYIQRFEKAGNV